MFHSPTYTNATSNGVLAQLTSSGSPFLEPPHHAELSSQFLRSCKTVYAEARPILFEVNTFDIVYAADLKLLKKLAGTCSTRIQALSYRHSPNLMVNKTRLWELKSLRCLKIVTIAPSSYFLGLGSMVPGERVSQSDVDQRHPGLGELMQIRPDIQFNLVCPGFEGPDVCYPWPHPHRMLI